MAESLARNAMGTPVVTAEEAEEEAENAKVKAENVEEDPENVPREEGFWITHYYERKYNKYSSSEFIRKKTVLNMTKTHGLGSGVYALITGSPSGERGNATVNGKVLYKMTNPVIISTDDELSCFSRLSIGLINACEYLVAAYASKDTTRVYEELNTLLGEWSTGKECSIFLNKIVRAQPDGKNILMLLHNTVGKWVHDYMHESEEGDYLYQPINYFLMGNYDGVYNNCPNGNRFENGSVYFRPEHHIPRAQDSAFTGQFELLPGKKLIPCNPVDLTMTFGGKRKKSKKSNKRRKSIKRR
jgi:hypothetical protein